MKNYSKLFGIIVLAAVMVFFAGCATASSIGGTSGPHGFFTGNGAASTNSEGADEIASYSVILGLFDAGYGAYDAAVKAAEAAGKKITSVTKNYLGLFVKVTAYGK